MHREINHASNGSEIVLSPLEQRVLRVLDDHSERPAQLFASFVKHLQVTPGEINSALDTLVGCGLIHEMGDKLVTDENVLYGATDKGHDIAKRLTDEPGAYVHDLALTL